MDVTILNTSDKPIYQQLYEQISAQIMRGELESDSCLPPIRTVAAELRISVITVKKAWEELERLGFIYTITGKGCFIAPLHPKELDDKRMKIAEKRIKKDAADYKELGLSLEDIKILFDKLY